MVMKELPPWIYWLVRLLPKAIFLPFGTWKFNAFIFPLELILPEAVIWPLFNLIWLFVLSEPILTSSPLPARRYKSLFEVILKALFPVDIISVPLLDSIDIPALSPFNVISFANKSPLALILPEAVMWPIPESSSEPVIPESPFLCPVDRKVCDADTKFWPCQEPEMSDAISPEEDIKFWPCQEPEIPAAVNVLSPPPP